MRGFASLLKAFRVVPAMPPATPFYQPASGGNADLSCDEYGALWVRTTAGGGGGGSGSLANSSSFSSVGQGVGLVSIYVARPDVSVGEVALQSVQAYASQSCYLQMFAVDTPVDLDTPLYEWSCPYPASVSQEFGFPWGLRVPSAATGMTFAFSSTPGVLSLGPVGSVQGIFTYA